MGIRGKVRALERLARDHAESFELLDGSRFYYDPTSPDIFMHWIECGRAGSAHYWPEPPEVLQKLCQAKDIEQAVARVRGQGTFNVIPYDLEALIIERRLEPRPLVSRYDPEAGKHVPIDPYEYDGPEDLSEP
jgi:hypothetical protein